MTRLNDIDLNKVYTTSACDQQCLYLQVFQLSEIDKLAGVLLQSTWLEFEYLSEFSLDRLLLWTELWGKFSVQQQNRKNHGNYQHTAVSWLAL